MRSFSNIIPNFAANLHLLVDSIAGESVLCTFMAKDARDSGKSCIFAVERVRDSSIKTLAELQLSSCF